MTTDRHHHRSRRRPRAALAGLAIIGGVTATPLVASASPNQCASTKFCTWDSDNFNNYLGGWAGSGSYPATANSAFNDGTSGRRVYICLNSNYTNCPISYSQGYATGHSSYANQFKSHYWAF